MPSADTVPMRTVSGLAARFLNHYAIVEHDESPLGTRNTGIVGKIMQFMRRRNSK